ncbi:hypothetical protein AGMMS50256_27510 [Betaproteobacteria bacterium]|nr:hypothetical protein AGMMS50256_27510 [Betaproteobacteria bacterium]
MRAYSAAYKSTLAATSAPEAPIVLLEITHPDLPTPVRVVNDSENITCNGLEYIACPFRCLLPDDIENQLPKATLAVDNVGRELMYWIETSAGGYGAQARFMQVMRSRPDQVEYDITLDMSNVKATSTQVTADLGYENIFTRPAITMRYDPFTAPGVF